MIKFPKLEDAHAMSLLHSATFKQPSKTKFERLEVGDFAKVNACGERLPKFRNKGKMIFNCIDWERDDISSPLIRKLHPTQKPVELAKWLIEAFSKEDDDDKY